MVEVDPVTARATQKLYNCGRYVHEDVICMPDNKTLYLTNDFSPAAFYKFVAHKTGDYSAGTLFAYHQQTKDQRGSWVKVETNQPSGERTTEIAHAAGATEFIRHEWITSVDSCLYITETGGMLATTKDYAGGKSAPASYFKDCCETEDNRVSDPYGRILKYDLRTQEMTSYLEGGTSSKNKHFNFSNPDGLTSVQVNGRSFLAISEDIISYGDNRTPQTDASRSVNEIYLLDLGIKNPTLDDLQRMLIAPYGAETTGGCFTPDGSTYFVSIQHPSPENPAPFNKSCVIAISGFKW